MRFRVLVALGMVAGLAGAQTPDPGETIRELRQRLEVQRRLLWDWGGLIRYGSQNTELPPPAPGENRVVFLGDEITERWGETAAGFFPGKPYLNRGVARQSSAQMLVRFRQDVISLRPKVVVIHAGANDIAAVAGASTQGMMVENFMSMVELARLHDIRVVLASVLPVCDSYIPQTRLRPYGKILGINHWLEQYAARTGSVYLNYFAAVVKDRAFRRELTADGFLPNDAGYRMMAPLAEQAIAEALRDK